MTNRRLTCDTCKFFVANNPELDSTRECHAHPPAVQLHVENTLAPDPAKPGEFIQQRNVTKFVAYPAPQPDWTACGEYKPDIIEAKAIPYEPTQGIGMTEDFTSILKRS